MKLKFTDLLIRVYVIVNRYQMMLLHQVMRLLHLLQIYLNLYLFSLRMLVQYVFQLLLLTLLYLILVHHVQKNTRANVQIA
jgi:hypothetical protein